MSYEKKLCVHMSFNIKRHRYTSVISWWYSSTPGCSGLRYLSVIIGNPSSGSVNQSHGGSCVMINSCAVQERGRVIPAFVWGVSLSRATSMFARHRLIASNESATSSALVSQSKSSGRADRNMRPSSFFWGLNCEGFVFAPFWEHEWHCGRENGNCSVVHSLLHLWHCLLIAVEKVRHHHPFLWVLWFGHMSSRSRIKSWLVINDCKRLHEEDAPSLRSS